jgi:putative ABC transport system permease protein
MTGFKDDLAPRVGNSEVDDPGMRVNIRNVVFARQAAFVRKYLGSSVSAEANLRFVLQPLTRIHLFSRARNEIEANGDFGRLVLFSAGAFFILIIACFNTINFSVASSVVRAREVGLRKVVGAAKRQIAGQFLGESFLVSVLALAAACLLARLLLPAFNALAGKSLVASDLWAGPTLIGLAGFVVLSGGLAGGYSALVLSSVLPAAALLAVGFQTARSARADPVRSLRWE